MEERRKPPKKTGRTFLVVVDDTEEMRAALRYACRRARSTGGRVALLRIVEPTEFQHFASTGNLFATSRAKTLKRCCSGWPRKSTTPWARCRFFMSVKGCRGTNR